MNKFFHHLFGLTLKILTPTILMLAFGTAYLPSLLQAATVTGQPQFRVKAEWHIGGKGGWGFLALADRIGCPRDTRKRSLDDEGSSGIKQSDTIF